MYSHKTELLPYDTNKWPKSIIKKQFMYCNYFSKQSLYYSLTERAHQTHELFIKDEFINLLGYPGEDWYIPVIYTQHPLSVPVYTRTQDWMMQDALMNLKEHQILTTGFDMETTMATNLSLRLKLVEERLNYVFA